MTKEQLIGLRISGYIVQRGPYGMTNMSYNDINISLQEAKRIVNFLNDCIQKEEKK